MDSPYMSATAAAAQRRRDPDGADAFFDQVTAVIDRYCNRRHLDVVDTLSGGALSAVVAVTDRHGRRSVVKVATSVDVGVAEAAVFAQWDATGTPRVWPRLYDHDPDTGLLHMEALDGVPAHKVPQPWSRTAATVAALIDTVDASPALPGLPTAAELFGAPLVAITACVDVTGIMWDWARLLDNASDIWARLDARPQRSCHGDLWAGNLMVGDEQVVAFDPSPCASSIEFDIARVVADGWNGPGFEARLDTLDRPGVDRDLAHDLALVFAVAQRLTFDRYDWDPTPIRAGTDEIAAAHRH